VALGRKNWLFAGSDDGGERAAAIYTLIGTAKIERLGSGRLPATRPRAHRRSPDQSDRGTTTVECRRAAPVAQACSLISLSMRPRPDAYPQAHREMEAKEATLVSGSKRGDVVIGSGIRQRSNREAGEPLAYQFFGCLNCVQCAVYSGGEGEIRTREALADPPVFKTGAINRSATSPGFRSPNAPRILAGRTSDHRTPAQRPARRLRVARPLDCPRGSRA
jgi:hypothetical protein